MVIPIDGVGQRDPQTIDIEASANVTLDGVVVLSAPRFVMAVLRNTGALTFRHVEVRPPTNSNRLISSWRDAFHLKDNRGAILFDGCSVQLSQDDAFNVSGTTLPVVAVLDGGQAIQLGDDDQHGPLPVVGDHVELYSMPTGQNEQLFFEPAPVENVVSETRTIRFRDPIAGLRNVDPVGTQLKAISIEGSNPNTTIRGARLVGPSMRLRSSNLVVEDGMVRGGVTWLYTYDVEGPIPRDMTLRGNSFYNSTGTGDLVIGPAPQRSIRRITVERNMFATFFSASGAEKILFGDNDFRLLDRGLIHLSNDVGVEIWGTFASGRALTCEEQRGLVSGQPVGKDVLVLPWGRDQGAGQAFVNDGAISACWGPLQTTGAQQISLAGNRIGILTTDGRAIVKEGPLDATWTTEADGAQQVSLSGNRIGVLTTDGRVIVKEGPLNATWTTETDGAQQISLSGNRIGVLTKDGRVIVKEGPLNGTWTTETDGAQQISLSGNRIGVLTTDGRVVVKEGPLNATWTTETSNAQQLSLSGVRIGVLQSDGSVLVKEGSLSATWSVIATGVRQIAMSDQRIAVIGPTPPYL